MMRDTDQQTQTYISKPVAQISLDRLNVTDCISIKTADHNYLFVVTDPEERRGVLTGGAGFNSTTSVLLGADMRKNGQVSALFSGLYQGSRAIFFIESQDGVRQFVTSEIIGLVYIEANKFDPIDPSVKKSAA